MIAIHHLSLIITVAVTFLSQPYYVVRSESVWHQLQDHNTASHIKRQEQKQPKEQKKGDQIYQYPQLFVDTKLKAPSSSSSSSTSSSTTTRSSTSVDVVLPTTATTTTASSSSSSTRKGMNMQMSMTKKMMTMTTTKTPTVAPGSGSNATRVPSSAITKQPSIAKSKTSFRPTVSNAPSAVNDASLTPSVVEGKHMMMMGMMMSMSNKKKAHPTPSPTVSAQPTYLDDDDGLLSTDSPTNVVVVDGVHGKGMMRMSKGRKDNSPTSSPSVSTEPTYIDEESFYPTMVMERDKKGGMMSMSMMSKEDRTFSPSASLVPSTSSVPTFYNEQGGKGMGMMMSMGMDSHSMMMMTMKKDKDDKMDMSKMTSPPVPTSPETNVPTSAPDIPFPTTNVPSASTNNHVELSPYTLRYTFINQTIPKTFEVDEVVALTRMYLANYFEIRYTDITEFITNTTGTAFVLQQPFLINYTSVAVFDTMQSMNDDDGVDPVIPPVEELNIILIAAFTTTNLEAYIELLQDLPPENVFRMTSNVSFMIDSMADNDTNTTLRTENDAGDKRSEKGSRHAAKVSAGVATAAGVLLIALISIVTAKRNRKNLNGIMHIENHDMPPNKRHPNNNNRHDDEGHMTVAGDTYLAESTVVSGGTASILTASTRQHRGRRFRSKRILSQSRALVLVPPPPSLSNETPYLTQSPPSSPSDVSMRRGISDIGSNEHYEDDNNASDHDIYENDDFDDDRSLLPFYSSSPEPAYQGALSVDANERRHGGPQQQQQQDVLLSTRDDMRLPRHFRSSHQYDDHIPNQMLLHHDIDENNDDDDTLSVDDDVPLRVIDLIRKFTPTKRHMTR